MTSSCSICHKTWAKEGFKKFHVPKDEEKRKRWSESCGEYLKIGAKVCSLHFTQKDFAVDNERIRMRLLDGALPKPAPHMPSNPKIKHRTTQTNPDDNPRLAILEGEVSKLRRRLKDLEFFESQMSSIFTEGQIRKIYYPTRALHWSEKDMLSAIALHAAGPNAYALLCQMGYPFPCESTIKNWLRKNKTKLMDNEAIVEPEEQEEEEHQQQLPDDEPQRKEEDEEMGQ